MNNLIGGNKTIKLYKKSETTVNDIGETENANVLINSFVGFLDYVSGEVGNANYKAPIDESTHIFISDYVEITENAEDLIAEIDSKSYEVKYIDNPMELNEQIEIYLKLIGGQ